MANKVALVSGVTGQDGSYLAELLLNKGYEVHGIVRRHSLETGRLERIDGIKNKIHLHTGDLLDESSIFSIVQEVQPDELYSLAAQSHVGQSSKMPIFTTRVDAVGVVTLLEAIRQFVPTCKFYQASSSEMFGSNVDEDGYQRETTAMHPVSPYGCAKLFSYHITRHYRSAYDMFTCNGILFNHETLTYNTPLLFRVKHDNKWYINILPIGDIVRFHCGLIFDIEKMEYQEGKPTKELEVWDKNGWTKVKFASGYPHKEQKHPRIINARNSVYSATGNHICFLDDDSEIETKELKVGDKVKLINYPSHNVVYNITKEYAEFLGMLVGDGNLKKNIPRFTNKDKKLKNRFEFLWKSFADGDIKVKYKNSKSGFTGEEIGQIDCHPNQILDYDIYTNDLSPFGHKNKKVPEVILNSTTETMEAFLIGYNACDGLKQNSCKYRFKNFKTNSATLASGLLFLVEKVTGQKYNITVEESWKYGKQQFYYSINLLSDLNDSIQKYNNVKELLETDTTQREISRITGISRGFIRKVQNGYVPNNTHHLELNNKEIKKIIEIPNYDGWFFDLETESGTFHAGIGQGLVHNSPRRGENFVTKKIVNGALDIVNGKANKLLLGNLEPHRDWGHAKDYCINLDVPILTNKGWKYYDDIIVGERIINFDSKNNILSSDFVKRKILLDSNGSKILLKGRGTYLNVTPNHRIYYQQKSSNSKGGWSDWKITTAKEFHDKLNNKSLRTKYDYRLPHFQNYDYHTLNDKYINEDLINKDVLYLLGCILTEGCLHRLSQGRGVVVSLSQSKIVNESIYTKISQAINRLKLDSRISHRNNGVVEWIFDSESSKRILNWFDKPNVHIMPEWCYNLDQSQAKILVDAMMDCDGHWGSMTYTSRRHLLAVDFQSLACIAGYRTTKLKIDKQNISRVCLITPRKKYTYITKTQEYNDGHKKVWCIETNNGTIITRDNGCISISGNCNAMWLMMQAEKPDDFVIATGETHSVAEFCDIVFSKLGLDYKKYVGQDPRYMRAQELKYLKGDCSKAIDTLGWNTEYTFDKLLADMIQNNPRYNETNIIKKNLRQNY